MVRKAEIKDVAAILQLIERNPETILPRTDQEISERIDCFYVAEIEGKIVGCTCLEVYSPKIAEVRTLAVDEQYRRRGIGRELVRHAVEDAEKQNIKEIMVVTSSPKFFENLNFGACLNEKYALFWNGTKGKRRR